MTIRAFDPTRDYPAIVAIFNANFPSFQETENEFRYGDDYREEKHHFARIVAEEGGVVAGYGLSAHDTHSFHPTKFTLEVFVEPTRQGEGFGKALFDHVVAALAPLTPTALRAYTIEGTERALRFLSDRGFVEEMSYAESWLDVAQFDASRFPGAEERVLSQGLRITTFAELGASDPAVRRKLYEFSQVIQADIPSPEPHTAIAYEVWEKRFAHSGYLPHAQFLAVDGEDIVGISALWGREADDHLQTGVTGILRSHRRRGIALALKLRAIAFAKERGCPIIRTDNEVNNEGMLSINRALGFVKQSGWVGFVRHYP
ncbi:GNAT family N-acetyltransferase [Armatimonas sp.]|uniref:GNAT family N-acetyltransferase n=1 Tax=Armatimonas sp. TaxID=1872638 RepID=UPI0037512B10